MALGLTRKQKDSIRKGDPNQVALALHHVENNLSASRWLRPSNAYLSDCIKKLFDHTQPGNVLNDGDLSEYIAASVPLHCLDGWALLGGAFEAHAACNPAIAVHLAYYAELRATMSLLAMQGIGIFDDRHFIIRSNGDCEPIGDLPANPRNKSWFKTHIAAWLILEYWADLKRSSELLCRVIKPGGIPLGDWLDAFGVGSMARSLGRKWLKFWGLDLKRLSEGKDREARNQSSYRPTSLVHNSGLNVIECSTFMRQLWYTYEPSPSSRFDLIDRHLLRRALEETHKSLPRTIRGDFAPRVSSMLSTLFSDKSSAVIDQWQDFLTRSIDSEDSPIVKEAAQADMVGHAHHHLQIISRANLLLRVATGACSELLHSGLIGNKKEVLKFWWNPIGESRGFWVPGNDPSDFIDLWEDIKVAADEVNNWESVNSSTASYAAWKKEQSSGISTLSRCERIALWGLGI